MYVIIGYDVPDKRTPLYHKILGKYLEWQQNSLFSGDITESLYKKLMKEISLISKEQDNIFCIEAANKNNILVYRYGKSQNNILQKTQDSTHKTSTRII